MPSFDGEQLHKMPSFAGEQLRIRRSFPDEFVDGAIIVGAGPSGMATAACLKKQGVPFVMLERAGCIASLWKQKTYDRLKMHIAKEYCELPLKPFDKSYPTFITRKQFIDYLEEYAAEFGLKPRFNQRVEWAGFDEASQTWRVQTVVSGLHDESYCKMEYAGRWLVIATGENAEMNMPDLPGVKDFKGSVIHSSQYRNGEDYSGKKVLVIGSGNSGMEIALDLVNCEAKTSIVVRSPLHVLPREVLGQSTFSVAMKMMKSLPVWFVDNLLVLHSRLVLGDTAAYGIKRPKVGPLELKFKMRKTPVLDVGTLARIQSGDIKIKPAIESLTERGARFSNGTTESFDAVIFATGYRSNVLTWLEDKDQFFRSDSLPDQPCPNNWRGKNGLYVGGLCNKGILGGTTDAQAIARDICEARQFLSGLDFSDLSVDSSISDMEPASPSSSSSCSNDTEEAYWDLVGHRPVAELLR